MVIPQLTLADYNERFGDRHLVHGIVAKWAAERGDAVALINADRGTELTWRELDLQSSAVAAGLRTMGLRKGDYFATSLPLTFEHLILEFACFKLGVIVAPLDLRLPAAEVIRSIRLLEAKAYAFLGATALADFRPLGEAVAANCPTVLHRVQFSPREECVKGAVPFAAIPASDDKVFVREAVEESDSALVIFTTGSTGSPKPARLSHRNITCQCMCLSQAFFEGDGGTRTLVNLPPSHVGCQTELLMGTLFGGGTAVLLETFDAARSLRAIERYRVNKIGQIPAMFSLEWRSREFATADLSSLDFVAYGGQQVTRAFLEKVAAMAPRVATGLGLTETAGFCTYIVEPSAEADAIFSSLGEAMPVYPFTIREPMLPDGTAGPEVPYGEVGEICFRGPQTFLGYVNDVEATRRTVSRDGWLYTGDLGVRDANGLRMTGRAKWVIKSFGYQIHPADVENHVAALEGKVAACAVVGAEHEALSEAVVAFVEPVAGADLTRQELERHARALPSYMRPRHWVLVAPGEMPLTRTAKADYLKLSEMARSEVERLRAAGGWDRQKERP